MNPGSIRDGIRRLFRLPLRTDAAADADADEEVRAFLAERIDYLTARGMSAADARTEAWHRLGASPGDIADTLHKSARTREHRMNVRDAIDNLTFDLRYAFRTLRRDAGFSVFAVLIAGLGIGASATVFSIANALLIRPLPFPNAQNLVWIPNGGTRGLSGQTTQVRYLTDLAERSQLYSRLGGYMAFYGVGDTKLGGTGEPERLSAVPVSQSFFPVLGVQPFLGRGFNDDESSGVGQKSVLLSYTLWKRRFLADSGIVGRAITLNDAPVTVVGILPESFDFGSVFAPGMKIDMFVPFPLSDSTNRWGNTLSIVGRLKPGITVKSAELELNTLAPQMVAAHPERNGWSPKLIALREHVSGSVKAALVVLAFGVGVVMLIVCANLSNLLLARATTRQREMAIRSALGAGRRRLIRQMLTESIVLSASGAVIGLSLAFVGTRAIARLNAVSIPMLDRVQIDAASFGFTVALALLAGLIFGLAPALQLPESAVQSALRQSGRGTTDGKRGKWMRNSLVVTEIALACVLLVGSGLLIRSFLKVLDVDLGFKPEMVASLRIDPEKKYLATEQLFDSYLNDALTRAKAVPGIATAAISDGLPLGSNRTWSARVEGKVYEKGKMPFALVRVISEGYIGAIGIGLKSGRDFTADDNYRGGKVILINESLAKLAWPGENPIGRTMIADTVRQVVGVVADAHQLALEKDAAPEMYLPIRQTGDFSVVNLVMRTSLPPASLTTAIRAALKPIAPTLATNQFQTLQGNVDKAVSPRRFFALLLGGFAVFALCLALLGIYAVISYTVNQRTQEIGVRMALGATAAELQRSILRETLILAGIGMLIGTIASWMLSRLLAGILFGVTAADPVTFIAMLAVLTAAAALAGYLPARRASRIDPLTALRAG